VRGDIVSLKCRCRAEARKIFAKASNDDVPTVWLIEKCIMSYGSNCICSLLKAEAERANR
jgi:hypothetical protein